MIDISKPYEYFAFISYKREDEKWAKWLQKKLETYSLPIAIRKEKPELPNKIRPVFRDQSELSGGNLKAEIEKGLNSSKYLIVICSPRSAKSPWVSKEVQHFIDQGREEYIIPFIIGGTPNASNPEDECFPEGLRQLTGEKEILGININEMGRDAATIKVIARMFNLRFDTLWQRFEKAKRRRRVMIGLGAFSLIIASISVAVYISYQNNILEYTNNKLEIANYSVKQQRDSIKLVNAILNETNDSLVFTKNQILLAHDSLKKSNHSLDLLNHELIEANINLELEKKAVMERDRAIIEKSLSLLIASANTSMAQGELVDARKLLSDAITIQHQNNLESDIVNNEYEISLRRLLRKYNEPGIHKIVTTTIQNSLPGAFEDDKIIIPRDNSYMSWSFNDYSHNVKNYNFLTNYQMLNISNKLGYTKDNIGIQYKDGYISIFDYYSNKPKGVPLFVGSLWNTHYKFSELPNQILISKDSILIKYDYVTAHSDTLCKYDHTINDFIESPINRNIIAIATSDTCISLLNKSKRIIYKTFKPNNLIRSLVYHPTGDYIVATGHDILLLDSKLTLLHTRHSDIQDGYYNSSFNNDGSLLYSYFHPGGHTIWSIGYKPHNFMSLSSNGKYGVIMKKNKYIVFDFEKDKEIPNISIDYETGNLTDFGLSNKSILLNKWNDEAHGNDLYVCEFESGKIYALNNLPYIFYDNILIADNENIVFLNKDNYLYSYNYKSDSPFSTYILNDRDNSEIKIRKIRYSKKTHILYVLTSKGELITFTENLTPNIEFFKEICGVKSFDIDSNDNIYIVDDKGYLYYLKYGETNKNYIDVIDNVDDISVDPNGEYLLTQFSYRPTLEFTLETKPYGYNTISETRIWDIKRKIIIDDLSEYKLTSASLMSDYNGQIVVKTRGYTIPFFHISRIENSILNGTFNR